MQHLKADWPFYNIKINYIYNKRYTFYCTTRALHKIQHYGIQYNNGVTLLKITPLLYFLIV